MIRTHKETSRNASLDTLRGLAIIYVIIGHYSHYFHNKIYGNEVDWYISGFGLGGVILFFMLSGHLIYQQLQWQDAMTFANRRFFRIFPIYWINIFIVFLFGILFSEYKKFAPWDYLSNLFMVQSTIGKATINGAYWSLIVEIEFYASIAVIFFVLQRRFLFLFPFAVMALNVILYVAAGRSSVFLTFLPLFFAGIFLRKFSVGEWRLYQLAAYIVLVILYLAFFQPYEKASVLIFCAVNTATFIFLNKNHYDVRILNFFGNISYSLYLYHTAIGFFLIEELLKRYPSIPAPATVAAVTAAMILLSYLSYRYVELYFIGFGRKLEPLPSRVGATSAPMDIPS